MRITFDEQFVEESDTHQSCPSSSSREASLQISPTHVFPSPVEGGDDVGVAVIVEGKNGMLTRLDIDLHRRMLERAD